MKTQNKLILFALSVLALRMLHTGTISFCFLIWNLFLAWVPFALSNKICITKNRTTRYLLLALTVLFLPNAPYIITDLFHLKKHLIAPLWMDTLLILSFALAGLWYWVKTVTNLMAILLHYAESRFVLYGGKITIMLLSAYGVYLGRYLRFNSWDVVADPVDLFFGLTRSLLSRSHLKETYAMTIIFASFLYLIYEFYENFRITKTIDTKNKD